VLRLTPLRSATVPRIAIIIIIITAGADDPGQRQHRSARRWPRTPLFSALLLSTAFVVLNVSISPAAKIIL
jgi:hypothetical protein